MGYIEKSSEFHQAAIELLSRLERQSLDKEEMLLGKTEESSQDNQQGKAAEGAFISVSVKAMEWSVAVSNVT